MNDTTRALAAGYIRDGKWEDVNRLLKHIDDEIRYTAAAVCSAFALQTQIDISPAVATLHTVLADEISVARQATHALSWHYVRKQAWAELAALLHDKRPLVRQASAFALGEATMSGLDYGPAVAELEQNLDDDDRGSVYSAVRALVFYYAMRKDAAAARKLAQHRSERVVALTQQLLNEQLLHMAGQGILNGIGLWLDLGAQLEARDKEGKTALMEAAKQGHTPVVATLLERGAQVDAADSAGRTALMYASFQGHPEVVTALIQKGAELKRQSNAEFTALDYACKSNQPAIAQLLHEKGAPMGDKNSVLNLVAAEGLLGIARIVLSHGANPNFQDANGFTALMYAALKGHADMAALLLEKGADPNIRRGADTALTYAQRGKQAKIVDLLKPPV